MQSFNQNNEHSYNPVARSELSLNVTVYNSLGLVAFWTLNVLLLLTETPSHNLTF